MKKRVLFMVETVTLAHIARSSTLALSLDPSKFEVIFAYGEASPLVLSKLSDFKLCTLRSCVRSKDFLAALNKGKVPYDLNRVKDQVEEDLRLMRELNPDLVVGDFRLTLAISARVLKIPYINISNSTWTHQVATQVPDISLVRIFGEKIVRSVFKMIQPMMFKKMARPFNIVAEQYGQKPLGSLYEIYTSGDRTLFADVPGLVKNGQLKKHQFEIGPIQFTPDIETPSWWQLLPKHKPLVYVNLGSSGQTRILKTLIDGLTQLPVTVVVGLAGAKIVLLSKPNLFVADYLPSTLIMEKSSLYIGNGGSASTYLALMRGVPVLSIPSNLDQMQFTAALNDWKVALRLRSENVSLESVKEAALHLLSNGEVKAALVEFQKRTQACNAPAFFSAIVESMTDQQDHPVRLDL